MLKLFLFVLPLGLDTFAVSAALGMRGLPPRARLRVSLLMSSFEMVMSVIGLLLGHAPGHLVGGAADYVAIAVSPWSGPGCSCTRKNLHRFARVASEVDPPHVIRLR